MLETYWFHSLTHAYLVGGSTSLLARSFGQVLAFFYSVAEGLKDMEGVLKLYSERVFSPLGQMASSTEITGGLR